LTHFKTPRALKRFQNSLRVRAMALDARTSPALTLPPGAGPIERWLAHRHEQRGEEGHSLNAILPEPLLVGLEALRTVLPESFSGPFERFADLQLAIHVCLALPSTPMSQQLGAVLDAAKNRTAPDGMRYWPPSDEHVSFFYGALESA